MTGRGVWVTLEYPWRIVFIVKKTGFFLGIRLPLSEITLSPLTTLSSRETASRGIDN